MAAGHCHRTREGFETRTFYANVRRPQLPPPPKNAPGGTEVHMFLAGEAEARCWDEKLTIEFNGSRPCLGAMEIVKDDAVPTIFVAGDSTVGDPRRGPGGNWPTQICQFFKPEVAVCNSAEGGETTKSFLTGCRLDKVLSQMKAGDFFLIQFGHNDSKAAVAAELHRAGHDLQRLSAGVHRGNAAARRHAGVRHADGTPVQR
jgi:hypothetical protein